jgi:predicted Zn-dependent peptidase
MLALEGSYSRMNRLARHELFLNKFVSLDQAAKEIDAVTLEQVRSIATKLFVEDTLTMVAMGPVDESLVEGVDWSRLS